MINKQQKTNLDIKIFESLAKKLGVPKKIRKEMFNMLECEVLDLQMCILANNKTSSSYLFLETLDLSQKNIDWNVCLKEESIIKAWDDYKVINSDLVNNIVSDIYDVFENYDCISYLDLSKKEKEDIVYDILKKY